MSTGRARSGVSLSTAGEEDECIECMFCSLESNGQWQKVELCQGAETAPGQLIRISVRRCAIDLLLIIANSCLLFLSPSLHRRFRQ